MVDKGYHLDLSAGSDVPASSALPQTVAGGKFLGIHFECCDIYSRVYPNKKRTAYLGYCPRCARQIKLRIGEGGTDARFFTAR